MAGIRRKRSRFTIEEEYKPVVDLIKNKESLVIRLSLMSDEEVEKMRNELQWVVLCMTRKTMVWNYFVSELGEDFTKDAYDMYMLLNTDLKLRNMRAC